MEIAEFKQAMSQFASGVTVVTTRHEGQNIGITANAFSSVSLEPMLVLVCVVTSLYSHQAIAESGFFAVNILAQDQVEWGNRFAGRPPLDDRFEGIDITIAQTGAPILPGVMAWVDCEVRHAYPGGDHTIFVGEVVAGGVGESTNPLMYYRSQWRELA